MFSTPFKMGAGLGRDLEEFLRPYGVELAPIAQSVGLEAADFQRSDVRVSLDSFTRLLDILKTIASEDCIGLRYGDWYRMGNSGAFGFALLHAPTLRQALMVYRDYQRLIADYAFFDVDIGLKTTVIEWRYSSIIDHPAQFVDMRARLDCRTLQRFLGSDWHPLEVSVVRSPPRSPALHRKLLAPNVNFDAPMNRIAFPSDALAAVSPDADPRLYDLMLSSCVTELAKLRENKDLRFLVKELILSVLPLREATLARVAPRLAISERSLQRRLAEAGTTFERLIDDTRRDLSDRLLMAGDTPISEISFLCGYSNASAYSRAARNWYGMPPAEVRRHAKGSQTSHNATKAAEIGGSRDGTVGEA